MQVLSVELKNFRNYPSLSVSFDGGTNVFYGDNAQGKTNILESVYLCGTTRSHRGSKDQEMIRFGEEEAHIRMHIRKDGAERRIDMHLRRNKAKGAAVDGIPVRRASELFGLAHFVFFSPEDLQIIKNGPKDRRRYVDSELCQLNRIYLEQLSSYNKIVLQRNKLLRDIAFSPDLEDTLDVWDMQLTDYGCRVIREREKFTEKLNSVIRDVHLRLTDGKEELSVIYEPSVTAEAFADTLKKSRDKDLKWKMTSAGPHRDDFCIMVNGVDMRHFGSQGQQRSAALSLKLSEIDLIRQMTKDSPVLLLDDVLSELDENRQKMLTENLMQVQTLITCTGMDEWVRNRFPVNRTFHVAGGKIE